MSAQLSDTIKALMCEHLGLLPAQLTDEARLSEDLGIDSLDAMDLIVLLDETFQIEIPEDSVQKIQTVSDLVAAVEAAQQSAAS